MSYYEKQITTITGCPPEKAAAVEELMRIEHPTLDGLSASQFRREAKQCWEAQQYVDCIEAFGITEIEFQSKAPHKTCWLHIEFDHTARGEAAQKLSELFSELEAVGWVEDTTFAKAPPVGNRSTVDLTAKGSADFGFWTPAEAKQFTEAALDVCKANGIPWVYHHKMTFAELI